ncbi:MAG: hypothetical protein GF398_18740 [Chitinivibrionales bacterium]|nr:hypothetical protein [Chitinivibrionales bacterium]
MKCPLPKKPALLLMLFAATAGIRAGRIDVVASGETHAMLRSCDCPDDPGGGLSRRAFVLNQARTEGDVLLLDAGGFSGGGLYDTYSQGRKPDSLRTLITLQAMARMQYDAIAIGDDDLQWGSAFLREIAVRLDVPLVSANCYDANGEAAGLKFISVERGGRRFAITAVTTRERLVEPGPDIVLVEPVAALRRIWPEMVEASDYQVILAHVGEAASHNLIDSFPECDLVVNGHRKSSTEPVTLQNGVPVMQFGFQGKKLSRLTVTAGDSLMINAQEWVNVSDDLPGVAAIDSLIATLDRSRSESDPVSYDLYLMSQCPYGLEALQQLVDVKRKFPGFAWKTWFIGDVVDDTVLRSLHGSAEVADEKIWLAVEKLHPERYPEFLMRRAYSSESTLQLLAILDIDTNRVKQWVFEHGAKQLALHYNRSNRLNINASPTLLADNNRVDGNITHARIAKAICAQGDPSPKCDSLPECFTSADCKQPGMVGSCIDEGGKGRCRFTKAIPFTFTVIAAESTWQHPHEAIIATTRELFPSVKVRVVPPSSPRAQMLMQKYRIKALPFYLFGAPVKQAHNFDEIASGLDRIDDGFTFENNRVPVNYFPAREAVRDRITVYIDPVFQDVAAVLAAVRAAEPTGLIQIRPALFAPLEDGKFSLTQKIRREEALRWLVVQRKFPGKYGAYLREYRKNPATTFWHTTLQSAGIKPSRVAKALEDAGDILSGYQRDIAELSIFEPVTILRNNRESIRVSNLEQLKEILQEMHQKMASH